VAFPILRDRPGRIVGQVARGAGDRRLGRHRRARLAHDLTVVAPRVGAGWAQRRACVMARLLRAGAADTPAAGMTTSSRACLTFLPGTSRCTSDKETHAVAPAADGACCGSPACTPGRRPRAWVTGGNSRGRPAVHSSHMARALSTLAASRDYCAHSVRRHADVAKGLSPPMAWPHR
jgi:hypothetical protein